ncbi:MAG: nitroreductase family protein [Bdellovibrionales bacterium]|nr:nitroreductase family protein [Bdellovibrionales bacterium]
MDILDNVAEFQEDEISALQRSRHILDRTLWRRSIRQFDPQRKVDTHVIENAIRVAMKSPSGANQEPWLFGVIDCPDLKIKIRRAAEVVETNFYDNLAPIEMLDALKLLNTNSDKAHLEDASHLVVIFSEIYSLNHSNEKQKNYYSKESVCIATGMLISALTYSGIWTLTHTPQPAGFLNQILNVEPRLKPVLILACGYPAQDLKLPNLNKKEFNDVCFFNIHKKTERIQQT